MSSGVVGLVESDDPVVGFLGFFHGFDDEIPGACLDVRSWRVVVPIVLVDGDNVAWRIDAVGRLDDIALRDLVEVGEEDIGELVDAHITSWVGRFGRSEEAESEIGIVDIVSIFSGIDEGTPVSTFAEIDPFLGADFELCRFPGGVAVGGSFDVPVLDFASGFGGVDVDREEDFEEFVGFSPIHPGVKSDTGGWSKADSLFDCGIAERFGELNGDSHRAPFNDFK